ncbi:MAG: hypothetical protein F6K00_31355 [Leptolyngbya sp. SIOISBB]|nr:hypothetical protein [Leptolyngbya sp. SIOISBB]
MAKAPPATLTSVSVGLPFGLGAAAWEADPNEQNATWELYVELVPRSRWMRNEALSAKR